MKTVFQIVFLLCCCLLMLGCLGDQHAAETKPLRPVMVLPISDVIDTETKIFTGVIQSAEQATLSFRVSGRIDKIPVKEGQIVKKGDILGRLDPHDYKLGVIMGKARLSEAKAANKLALAEYNRIKQASLGNAIAAIKLERAESALEQSIATINVMQQTLQQAENALSYTLLTSPFNGVVGKIHVNEYEQVNPGLPVLELHQPKNLEAVIDVPERFISRFAVGQSGILAWNGRDREIPVKVGEISSVAHPVSRTYAVTFRIPGHARELMPGKSVVVTVPLDHAEDSICIPYEALLQKDNRASVFIVDGQRAIQRPVQVACLLEKRVCIRGELDRDASLIVAGLHFLKDGQTIGEPIRVE
ncbi:hemolysin secretion protein D [Desulfosarcina ovata subsp. sediminis]|uniref:Hemolysin secretion protein D n=1 Tax=Desulfosarcina ovata subsp. sediminis TaxID=885957 RepID=A0A5K7ZMU1_9BACT|nr:efflux RND transporter periplasmic adaptor subunit [Desulfosarcina ovata]BBO80939.1 hemolysin secretion protein D [Desulfosarcina ovata subsp. sediminis]